MVIHAFFDICSMSSQASSFNLSTVTNRLFSTLQPEITENAQKYSSHRKIFQEVPFISGFCFHMSTDLCILIGRCCPRNNKALVSTQSTAHSKKSMALKNQTLSCFTFLHFNYKDLEIGPYLEPNMNPAH